MPVSAETVDSPVCASARASFAIGALVSALFAAVKHPLRFGGRKVEVFAVLATVSAEQAVGHDHGDAVVAERLVGFTAGVPLEYGAHASFGIDGLAHLVHPRRRGSKVVAAFRELPVPNSTHQDDDGDDPSEHQRQARPGPLCGLHARHARKLAPTARGVNVATHTPRTVLRRVCVHVFACADRKSSPSLGSRLAACSGVTRRAAKSGAPRIFCARSSVRRGPFLTFSGRSHQGAPGIVRSATARSDMVRP